MEKYNKREQESEIEYLLRLTETKMEEKPDDLEWATIVELCGLDCHYDSLRKAMQPKFYGGYSLYKYLKEKYETSTITEDIILKEYESKRREFEKEKIRFYDQRTAYNKINREEARFDELKDILLSSVDKIKPYEKILNPKLTESDNDLIIGLNDIHFGIEIDNHWNKYNSEIAKKRLEKYLAEIILIRDTHNSENCHIVALGDLISGNIHYTIALANKENLIEQVMGVSELVSWFVNELSNIFNRVDLYVVPGNHSRLTIKENAPKKERLDDLIPFYVKARLQNLKNVFVKDNLIDSTVSIMNIRGLIYVGVHGDYDKIGNTLKLASMLPYNIYGIVSGHLHHNTSDFMQGYKILMSGSLMGIDDYCIEHRIFGIPQQQVSVCNSNGVRCSYDINF